MGVSDETPRPSEGVFAAPPERVAALLDMGTSGDGGSGDPGTAPGGTGAAPDDSPPEVPGYEITGKLGEGGMGTVWRAVQLSTRRAVALKLVGASALGSHRSRMRFDREVQLAARLEHPNLARVYDSGMSRGAHYFAMELVEGRHLDCYVREEKLGRAQVLSLFRDVCLAVQSAHQRGIIHRDIKPTNVLVTADGRPKVLDFGLAKAVDGDEAAGNAGLTLTMDGQWAGTPAFMAPEQAAGRSDAIDTRTDVYGLGATLYLLLTGEPPHDQSGARYEVMQRIASDEVRPTRRSSKALGGELESLLLKALAHDPDRRYASAGELAADVDRYLRGEPLAARAATPLYVLLKGIRRHRLALATSGLVLALLAGPGVYSYFRVLDYGRRAEASATLAAAAGRLATQRAADEALARRQAELHLAAARLAQGDGLAQSGQWADALARYEEAGGLFDRLGESRFTADLAIGRAYIHSPPPLLHLAAHSGAVAGVAFLAGGGQFVSAGEDGVIAVRDAHTGRLIRAMRGAGRVRRLSLTRDERVLACASPDAGVTLWDLHDWKRLRVIHDFEGEATTVALSPHGGWLFVGTAHERRNAYVFEVASEKRPRVLEGHQSAVLAAAFTPDGRRLFTAGGQGPAGGTFKNDTRLRSWDVETWTPAGSAEAGQFQVAVTDLSVSRDGGFLLSGGRDGDARLWQLGGSSPDSAQETFPARGWSGGVALTSDGALAALASSDGSIALWRTNCDQRAPSTVLTGHARGATAVAFSPDGKFLLSAGADGSVDLWLAHAALAPEPSRELLVFEPAGAPAEKCPTTWMVAFSPDDRLALSDTHGTIRLWDVGTGKELASATGPPTAHALAAFSADGAAVLVGAADGTVGVHDLTLTRTRSIGTPTGFPGDIVAASPDGRLVFSASVKARDISAWNFRDGSLVRTLAIPDDPGVVSVRCSPAGDRLVAVGTRGTVAVWEMPAGELVRAWPADRVTLARDACFSPSGKEIATAGPAVNVLDVASGAVLRTLRNNHFATWTAAYTPDGKYVACGADDQQSLALWDASGGGLVWTSHLWASESLQDVTFSRDGLRVLSAQVYANRPAHLRDFSRPGAYRQFAPRLVEARRALDVNPRDGAALRALGEWYAFRGVWDWAATLLEGATAAGEDVPPLLLARCQWMNGNPGEAAKCFEVAKARSRDAAEARYLNLCLGAAQRDANAPKTPAGVE